MHCRRAFRVRRLNSLRLTGQTFPDDPGAALADGRRLHGL